MKRLIFSLLLVCAAIVVGHAQTPLKKVYDETINPMEQIDRALATARSSQQPKLVICQVGGNWCPWCLRFADFAATDPDIAKVIDDHFLLIHVNYHPRKAQDASAEALMSRLGHPQRFGFPVFVVLDGEGRVVHIQDSSFLEEGKGYSKEKMLRFLNAWTPEAIGMKKGS